MVEKLLLPYLDGRKIVGARPSSYWVTYVYSVMTDLGYGRNVAAHIRRMFGPMIPYGGTWETFEFTLGKGSTSHAWSAHSVYHLPGTVGGLRQAEPAWKRVIFAPVTDLPGVDHAATTVPTPHGLIRAQWQRGGTGLDVRLSLPRGVTADVQLPGMVAKIIKGRQRWTLPGR